MKLDTKPTLANPTQATGVALRKVFSLLEDQFDIGEGQYRNDYSDDRIAKETGISVDAVKSYRVSAFGKIKPPTELYSLQIQVRDLEELYLKTENEMKSALKDIRAKLTHLQRRFD